MTPYHKERTQSELSQINDSLTHRKNTPATANAIAPKEIIIGVL